MKRSYIQVKCLVELLCFSWRVTTKGYDSAKTILHGGQFGMDRIFFQKYILGTAIDYSYSRANFQKYAGRSNSESVGLSFYGKLLLASDFYTQARLGISRISTRVEREVLHKKSDIHHKDTMYSSYIEFGKTLISMLFNFLLS